MNLRILALDPSITAFGWCVLEYSLAGAWRLIAAGVLETKPLSEKQRKAERISVTEDDARRVRFLRRELVGVFHRYQPAVVAVEGGAGSSNAKTAKLLGEALALTACVIDQCMAEARAIYVTPSVVDQALGLATTQRAARPKKTDAALAQPMTRTKKEILADIRRLPADGSAEVDIECRKLNAELKALTKKSKEKRDARKLAIAEAVVRRFGLSAWISALSLLPGGTTLDDVRDRIMAHKWEGAHDAAGIGCAVLDHPVVAALRAMQSQVGGSARERVLQDLQEKGPRSFRELEDSPPVSLSPSAARIAAQALLDEGAVTLNDRLKLAPIGA